MGKTKTTNQECEDQLQVALSEFVSVPGHASSAAGVARAFDKPVGKRAVAGAGKAQDFGAPADGMPGLRLMGF